MNNMAIHCWHRLSLSWPFHGGYACDFPLSFVCVLVRIVPQPKCVNRRQRLAISWLPLNFSVMILSSNFYIFFYGCCVWLVPAGDGVVWLCECCLWLCLRVLTADYLYFFLLLYFWFIWFRRVCAFELHCCCGWWFLLFYFFGWTVRCSIATEHGKKWFLWFGATLTLPIRMCRCLECVLYCVLHTSLIGVCTFLCT